MDEEVLHGLERAAAQTFIGTPVRFAYLFGSQATGTAGPDSDIDMRS